MNNTTATGIFVFSLIVTATILTLPMTAAADTFVVDSIADDADANPGDLICATAGAECTLRAAIEEANLNPNIDVIHFDIAGCPDEICVISLVSTSLLPDIVSPVTIDGSTQPGNADVCLLPIADRPPHRIVLEGDGNDVGPRLEAGSDGSTIRGLNLRRFFNALPIINSNGNTLECNFVGTDHTGMVAGPGNTHNAVVIGGSSSFNLIGGVTPNKGNLLSANGVDGVQITGGIIPGPTPDNNVVVGNIIGLAKDGSTPLGNVSSGVSVYGGDGPDGTMIGAIQTVEGGFANSGNVASSNGGSGVFIDGDVVNTTVVANLLGTDVTGTLNRGNFYDGVTVQGGATATIGGTDPAAANVLAGNGYAGAYVATSAGTQVLGNLIGVGADGTTAIGNGIGVEIDGSSGTVVGDGPATANVISHNSGAGVAVYGDTSFGNRINGNRFLANGGPAIDLGNDGGPNGATPNDLNDDDLGPNLVMNFPVITDAVWVGSDLEITSTLDTDLTNATYPLMVEIFKATADGEEPDVAIAMDSALIPGSLITIAGNADDVLGCGGLLVATATDDDGNTSEVSFGGFLVGPNPIGGCLFADGFESGDTSGWSSDIP